MVYECTKVIYNHQLESKIYEDQVTNYYYATDSFAVGENGVERITQDFSDPRVFNIHYADNTMETIYNAHRAFFNKRGF